MSGSNPRRSISFFDAQFQNQVSKGEYALNPFELLALDHLAGEVLDLGCGLGNLSLEAARRGCQVVAVDASPAGIARLNTDARREGLRVDAVEADLESWRPERDFDAIVSIGLLMFFSRERALALLDEIQARVRPGGRVILNVLIEGTTFMGMFEPGHYHLFGERELETRFTGWEILLSRHDRFPAPGETQKVFHTLIAAKPAPAAR